MEFNSEFFKEEIRSDFLVTEKRKKVWAVELQILEEFDRVCKKHNLTWYADYGTLLGAARHQGFIPWDDDIDVTMFRDDYMKLLAVASEEFTEPYFFQTAYNDVFLSAFSKLRDSRTTAIEFPDIKEMNQGIFIDVFPLDDVPDSKDSPILRIQTELWLTIVNPEIVYQEVIKPNSSFLLDSDILIDLLKCDVRQRMAEFESFNLTHFGKTEKVNVITSEMNNISRSKNREYYKEIIYLPFENIYVPAPKEYDKILTLQYGDWHEHVKNASMHEGIKFDPDTPYTKYM